MRKEEKPLETTKNVLNKNRGPQVAKVWEPRSYVLIARSLYVSHF